MKAKWRKVAMAVTAFVMASTMAIGFTACGDKGPGRKKTVKVESDAEFDAYMEQCDEIYGNVLGDFKAAYEVAKAEKNLAKRYALMAVAEAKLLESGVMLPTSTQGGNYAISRAVPYSASSVLWGNDSDRLHSIMVCTEPLTSEVRTHLKAKYKEVDTAEEYITYAKTYLAAQGYTIKNTYTAGYSSDPVTYDILNSSEAVDAEVLVNTFDGLLEYDQKNELKPALATNIPTEVASEEEADDTVSYTFQIREGAKWVNSQGQEVADVKADDFVAGFQHMLDAKAGLEWLVEGLIVGASEYIKGDKDFTKVGVKADEAANTVTYTLTESTSHFLTMLGYSIFAPMSRSYYTSKGGKFGAEYEPAAESYTYGKTYETIAYCGPFTITTSTKESTIEFTKNASYWNAENVGLNKITWLYNDGTDATKAYNDMKAGTIDGAGLNAQALALAKTDKVGSSNDTWFDKYHYVSGTTATTFSSFANLNRYAFEDIYDGKAASKQTAKQAELANAAMQNVHFRLALAFALDRGAYNAVSVGDDLKLNSLRNSYTPGTFVSLPEATTIKINGTDTNFAAGTYYGAILQAQLDADNAKIKAWDPTADGGVGSSDGFDGWYSVTNAKAELALALADLAEAGYEVSKSNPIHLDYVLWTASTTFSAKGQVYKQSIADAFEGVVSLDFINATQAEWYYSGYYTDYGFEANFDLYDLSGWGPDYGDPSTYLDTFLDGGAGYMTKCVGLY